MLILMLAGLLVLFYTAVPVSAASSVKISGGNDVKVGDTFTVNVVFQGDSVGSVSANLKYDKNVLQYVSGGSSSGDTGFVYLEKDVVDEEMSFQIKFKAKDQGHTDISVETYEMYDMDYNYLGAPSANTSIDVAASPVSDQETASSEELTEGETSPSDTVTAEPEAENSVQETGGFNLWLLGGIAVVLVLLIVLIAVKLKRK